MLETISQNDKYSKKIYPSSSILRNKTKAKINSNINKVRFIFSEKIIIEIINLIENLVLDIQKNNKKGLNKNGELRSFITQQLNKKKPLGEYMVEGVILENLYNIGKRDEILLDIGLDIIFIGYEKGKKPFYISILYSQFILQCKKEKNVRSLDGLIRNIKKKKRFRKGN